ncbi:hypothetical protein [Arcobacter sp.]|uniref:hypothetical protein n=1 Tax=Arcobacter sp. TaxID=1872629 RepID=UPI003D113B60
MENSFKTSDTIFILAPGSSINNYSDIDFRHISKHDSIGINNFIIHEFKCSLNLLETQPKDFNYFNLIREVKKLDNTFLYKGYASLNTKKFKNFLNNIKDIPNEIKKFYFAKDAYAKGYWKEIDENFKSKILNKHKSDFIYNYISSLNYAVMLSYKLGYRNIVLCGFDMDNKYFYCENKKYETIVKKYDLCIKSSNNIINDDDDKLKEIFAVLQEINHMLNSNKNGNISFYYSNKILSKFFKEYKSEK